MSHLSEEGGPAVAQARREQQLTDEVVASFETSPSSRYREVMQALVRHLHAFARDVRLTEQEWETAIEFLTRAGHLTDDKRQEFILASDVLGVSMLTVGINQPAVEGATEATVFGPFFVADTAEIPLGGDIAQGHSGQPCWVDGAITDTAGRPIAGARIEVWEADDAGKYDVQYGGDRSTGRAHLFADKQGHYEFWAVTPTPYPVPGDGPVGELLTAAGRGPMRPAHLHFMVTASGYRRLVTHIFVSGGAYLDEDAVFGVKQSLIVDFVEQPDDAAPPGGRVLETSWTRAHFDVRLAKDDNSDG